MENMDDRKLTGRIADEMEAFFGELPEAGFCLDAATPGPSIRRWALPASCLIVSARGYGRFTSARSAAVTARPAGDQM